MEMNVSEFQLWPTKIWLAETDPNWHIHKTLYDFAIDESGHNPAFSSERRVRDILDRCPVGPELKTYLLFVVKEFIGEKYAKYVDPDYCENRALVMKDRGFINTHKDNREGDVTCVHYLTGSDESCPILGNGNPTFVLEDSTRYFDEPRLPFEGKHQFRVAPKPGTTVVFPSYVPHNQHPFVGDGKAHVQIVANFRVELPTEIEEGLFD